MVAGDKSKGSYSQLPAGSQDEAETCEARDSGEEGSGHARRSSDSDDNSSAALRSAASACSPLSLGLSLLVLLLLVALTIALTRQPTPSVPSHLSFAPSSLASSSRSPVGPSTGFRSSSILPVVPGRTLVVVVVLYHNEVYRDNFAYLVRKAVRCWQDADYVVVVQRDDAANFTAEDGSGDFHKGLPALPANGRYVLHENKCLDWGSLGWLLSINQSDPRSVDTSQYRYFAMVNTGVRGCDTQHSHDTHSIKHTALVRSQTHPARAAAPGLCSPMLPEYLEERMDPAREFSCSWPEAQSSGLVSWYDVFLYRIRANTRFVGCSLNCMLAPHVQSYAVFFDFVALQVLWRSEVTDDWVHEKEDSPLLQASRRLGQEVERSFAAWQAEGGVHRLPGEIGNILHCGKGYYDTVKLGEVGSSQSLVRAGFNIESLMRAWQGVDWTQKPNACTLAARGEELNMQSLIDPLNYGEHVNRSELTGARVMMYHTHTQHA